MQKVGFLRVGATPAHPRPSASCLSLQRCSLTLYVIELGNHYTTNDCGISVCH